VTFKKKQHTNHPNLSKAENGFKLVLTIPFYKFKPKNE